MCREAALVLVVTLQLVSIADMVCKQNRLSGMKIEEVSF